MRCALCALMGGGERYAALMAGWMVFSCKLDWHHALAEGNLVSRSLSCRFVSSRPANGGWQWGSGDGDALAGVVSTPNDNNRSADDPR